MDLRDRRRAIAQQRNDLRKLLAEDVDTEIPVTIGSSYAQSSASTRSLTSKPAGNERASHSTTKLSEIMSFLDEAEANTDALVTENKDRSRNILRSPADRAARARNAWDASSSSDEESPRPTQRPHSDETSPNDSKDAVIGSQVHSSQPSRPHDTSSGTVDTMTHRERDRLRPAQTSVQHKSSPSSTTRSTAPRTPDDRPSARRGSNASYVSHQSRKTDVAGMDEGRGAARRGRGDGSRTANSSSRSSVRAGGASGALSVASTMYDGVKAKLSALSLEVQDKEQTVQMLQARLQEARTMVDEVRLETQSAMQVALQQQKAEYEDAIRRHLDFIDAVVADKKTLAEKVKSYEAELRTIDSSWEVKMKALADRHQVDMKRAKDQWEFSEKGRREKWMVQQTKSIKEATAKALEPEVQRLIENHRAEVRRLKEAHKEEVLQIKERIDMSKADAVKQVRSTLDRDIADAVARERDSARERENQLVDEYESKLAQLRSTVTEKLDAEQARLANRLHEATSSHQTEVAKLRQDYESRIDALQQRLIAEREALSSRQARLLSDRSAAETAERREWEERVSAQLRKEAAEREKEAVRRLKEQRDEQIQMVIARLDSETETAKEKLRTQYEAKSASERSALEKQLLSMERRANAAEAESDRLKHELALKDTDVGRTTENAKRMHEQLQKQCADAERRCRDLEAKLETADRERRAIETELRDEIFSLKGQLQDAIAAKESESRDAEQARIRLQHEHDTTVANLQQRKADELADVEVRVKKVLGKRDERIASLQRERDSLQERLHEMEEVLRQQRRDLLGDSLSSQ